MITLFLSSLWCQVRGSSASLLWQAFPRQRQRGQCGAQPRCLLQSFHFYLIFFFAPATALRAAGAGRRGPARGVYACLTRRMTDARDAHRVALHPLRVNKCTECAGTATNSWERLDMTQQRIARAGPGPRAGPLRWPTCGWVFFFRRRAACRELSDSLTS